MVFPYITFYSILPFPGGGDEEDMAENYIDVHVNDGTTAGVPSLVTSIGYARADKIIPLVHAASIDDGEIRSLHLARDDSTSYQNTTGKTAYAYIQVSSSIDSGTRSCKIYSSPNDNSISGATEVFDSVDVQGASGWNSAGRSLSSVLIPIQNNHFIVIQNTSGASPLRLSIPENRETFVLEIA